MILLADLIRRRVALGLNQLISLLFFLLQETRPCSRVHLQSIHHTQIFVLDRSLAITTVRALTGSLWNQSHTQHGERPHLDYFAQSEQDCGWDARYAMSHVLICSQSPSLFPVGPPSSSQTWPEEQEGPRCSCCGCKGGRERQRQD